jgi:hypothetical protein
MDIALNPAARWNEPSRWFLAAPSPTQPDVRLAGPRTLRSGQTLRVDDALGTEVVCIAGSLWVTHDGEPEDVIVEPGRPYRARHGSTMLVHALGESRCLVVGAA